VRLRCGALFNGVDAAGEAMRCVSGRNVWGKAVCEQAPIGPPAKYMTAKTMVRQTIRRSQP